MTDLYNSLRTKKRGDFMDAIGTIGSRIKQIRKSRELTQQAFAERLGLKQNTIATYEIDRTFPSDRHLRTVPRQRILAAIWHRGNGCGNHPAAEVNPLLRRCPGHGPGRTLRLHRRPGRSPPGVLAYRRGACQKTCGEHQKERGLTVTGQPSFVVSSEDKYPEK